MMNIFCGRHILRLLVFAALMLQLACRTDKNDLQKAVHFQVSQYPQSTLIDIYKSFFQDEFGPGHLLGDTAAARLYLDYELGGMTSHRNYSAEPCGLGMNFVRVPLDLVKDSIVPYEDYLAAFLESGRFFKTPEVGPWKLKWDEIVGEIETMDMQIRNFEEDKDAIQQMLEQGEYVVHHSEGYTKAYNPHYRIMRIEDWQNLNSKFKIQNSKFKK